MSVKKITSLAGMGASLTGVAAGVFGMATALSPELQQAFNLAAPAFSAQATFLTSAALTGLTSQMYFASNALLKESKSPLSPAPKNQAPQAFTDIGKFTK